MAGREQAEVRKQVRVRQVQDGRQGQGRQRFVIRSESGRYRTAGRFRSGQAEWSEPGKTRKQTLEKQENTLVRPDKTMGKMGEL
jgi:hypothetical protein